MKLIFFCSLFVWLSSAHDYEVGKPDNLNCNCGWTDTESDKTTHPWVVAILIKNTGEFMCAGTILTEWHVLSSADCFGREKPRHIVICIGSDVETNCQSGGKKINVKRRSIINGYVSKESKNNVAIAQTKDKIVFNKYIGPPCFPLSKISNQDLAGTELVYHGMGFRSTEFKRANFIVETQDVCTRYTLRNEVIHICAAKIAGQPYTKYVLGGSFVKLNTDTGRYDLVGIIDFWSMNESETAPSLLTNFTAFIDWAKKKIRGTIYCHQVEPKNNFKN